MACRHHVMELSLAVSALYLDLLEGLPLLCSGGSSKAGHTLTKRQLKWLPTTSLMHIHFCSSRRNMVKFCKAALEGSHQREDYEEFLKLSLIFQGGAKGARVSFQAPGAFHHARLMVKAIFSIKIFLFQQLLSPTAKEKHSVKELALFVRDLSIFGSGMKLLCL